MTLYRRTEGFGKLIERLNRIPKKVRAEVEAALLKSAEESASVQRLLVPEDQGDLKASIAITPPGEQTPKYASGGRTRVPEGAVAITAGNDAVRYAHHVEFGTSRAKAQPFFWPGFRMTRTRNKRRIKRALKKAMKESKNGG